MRRSRLRLRGREPCDCCCRVRCEREKLTTLYSVPQSRGASVGAYHRRGYPHRDSVKKVPVFSRLRETCRLKILQVNDLAAESSQKRTYESLWRRVASPRLKSAIEGRKPNRSTGQFPAPDECSLRRNALSVLCALGGKYHAKPVWFCFCFGMKGLGSVEMESSLTGIVLSQVSATPATWTCRRGPR